MKKLKQVLANIQQLVKDPEWQKLRKSLVGTWKDTPADNVQKLRDYLGPKPWTDAVKLRIVHNYLTGSGFRIGVISHPDITNLRNQVIKARKT
jgi:hypothetical protein